MDDEEFAEDPETCWMEQIDLNRPCLEEKLHKHMPGEVLAGPSYPPRQPVRWGLGILNILTTENFLTYFYKNAFFLLIFSGQRKRFPFRAFHLCLMQREFNW